MKKVLFVLLAVLISVSFVSMSFARDKGDEKYDKKEQHCPMYKMMGGKELLATQDGGVVLMMGNKLIKYDAQLNLVKEAEIKIDMEAMKKMMEEMKKCCPMFDKECKKGEKK